MALITMAAETEHAVCGINVPAVVKRTKPLTLTMPAFTVDAAVVAAGVTEVRCFSEGVTAIDPTVVLAPNI